MSDESFMRELAQDPSQRRRLLAEVGTPLIALGAIPEGHEDPYHPTPEELAEGYTRAVKANAALTKVLAKLVYRE